jgi:nitroreductase
MFQSNPDQSVIDIVRAAGAAPSIHNTQPWRFAVAGDILELHADPDRALRVADTQARALYLSCGAALFNARLAIRMTDHDPVVRLLPHPEYPFTVLAAISARPSSSPTTTERALYHAIWRRRTNRAPFTDQAIPQSVATSLKQAAYSEHASLRMLTKRDAKTVLAVAAEAGRQLAAAADHQAELRQWIATGLREDGIPAANLPPPPSHAPAPVRDSDFLAATVPQQRRPPASYEKSPQLAVLTTAHDEPDDLLRAGQALQRVLLNATVHGISVSFLYQPIEVWGHRDEDPSDWPWPENPQMILRLGYYSPRKAPPRRKPEDVLLSPAARQAYPRLPTD